MQIPEPIITYFTDIKIYIGPGAALSTAVGFSAGLDARGVGLLGQHGLFDSFNVLFSHKEKRVYIETA